jgi:4-hydroxybenzoate polyprenyltransferase
MRTLRSYLSLIRFSHTVFALPFALIGFFLPILSGEGKFSWRTFILVMLCMVFARSAAMAFNRLIDRNFDAKNPRTAGREIPAGTITPMAAGVLVWVCCVAFCICCWQINKLCLVLSPVALAVILGYSYTKRFTPLCHLILGIGLALAPIGAFVAVTGEFSMLPILFGALVFFWVSGFDVIYSLQDEDFDRSHNLRSIPVLLGKKNALLVSRIMHLLTGALLVIIYQSGLFGWLYVTGAAVFAFLLVYQQLLVKPHDLSRVNLAFGTTNGIASVVFCVFVCADIFVTVSG